MAPGNHQHDDQHETISVAASGTAAAPVGRGHSRTTLVVSGVAFVAAAAVAVAVAVASTTAPSPMAPEHLAAAAQDPTGAAGPAEPVTAPRPVSDAELAALPQATTFATVPDAPRDDAPVAVPSGRIVQPRSTVPVYVAPGDRAIAVLPATQLVSDTSVPVVEERPGWVRVLLPVRPNGSTGWLYLDDPRIDLSRTPYRIVVDRASFTLTLFENDHERQRWKVGVGKPNSVTPTGRTFLLASIKDTQSSFSPIILPLGFHSDTYTSYGGGPGTVGIHTWPTPDVYGTASSDGCVRVPPDALSVLSGREIPLGTPVLVS